MRRRPVALRAPDLALQEAEVAIDALLHHFPGLALAVAPSDLERQLFPGAWRLSALPLRL
ncbi:cytochrome P450 (plasmid) [Streptomyces sp. BHT-5-2]|uniref:cytochrome P450 n=1 Tax=Streptomyces sp. BHT-5-2 TaxID=2866715 RepID=UPI001C8F0B4A|nr:cytochrome P450 [Streptomyces sp. BHT-5-2]QZL08569.1 cytochrome P450 [Streptomyces sp. BHT-5-2]